MIAGTAQAEQTLGAAGPGFAPSLDRTSSAPTSCGSSRIAWARRYRAIAIALSVSSCKHPRGGPARRRGRPALAAGRLRACHDRAARFVVLYVPAPWPRAGRVMAR